MTEHDEMKKKPLGLARPGKLELKKTVETGQVRQNFSHGRSKMVTVEVRKKRTYERGAGGKLHAVSAEDQAKAKALAEAESTLKAGLDAVAEVDPLERVLSAGHAGHHDQQADGGEEGAKGHGCVLPEEEF